MTGDAVGGPEGDTDGICVGDGVVAVGSRVGSDVGGLYTHCHTLTVRE